jgi:hypothetical protein
MSEPATAGLIPLASSVPRQPSAGRGDIGRCPPLIPVCPPGASRLDARIVISGRIRLLPAPRCGLSLCCWEVAWS